MPCYSAMTDARTDALHYFRERGGLTLDDAGWKNLRYLGFSRGEVSRIVDRLADNGEVKLVTTMKNSLRVEWRGQA